MLPDLSMVWRGSDATVERIGDALWIECDGGGLLVDAPAGTAGALGSRKGRLRSVLLTGGRLDRVSGLVGVLAGLDRGDVPLVVRFPVSDERGAFLVEAWQRGWGHFPVTLDAVGPGEAIDIGPLRLDATLLSDGDVAPLGVRLRVGSDRIGILPRARANGAATRVGSNCDLLVVELGGGLDAGEAVRLAGDAELWLLGAAPNPT